MPPPDRQLSTFTISELNDEQIWKIGRAVLDDSPQPKLYGRADLLVGVVRANGLKAMRDDDPHRHVNVVGWPILGDDDAEKSAAKSIAQELAAEAVLQRLGAPIEK